MLKVAITGNIASGKSHVLEYFKKNNFSTLSLDDAVSEIYKKNDFIEKISLNFNTSKKKEIANIVFNDKSKMKELEGIIYPFILKETLLFIEKNPAAAVEAPMLFEYGFEKYFDKIIFVQADENIRKMRLMRRSNLTETEALKRINLQEKEEGKIKKSDFVIYNNKDISFLEKECKEALLFLRQER